MVGEGGDRYENFASINMDDPDEFFERLDLTDGERGDQDAPVQPRYSSYESEELELKRQQAALEMGVVYEPLDYMENMDNESSSSAPSLIPLGHEQPFDRTPLDDLKEGAHTKDDPKESEKIVIFQGITLVNDLVDERFPDHVAKPPCDHISVNGEELASLDELSGREFKFQQHETFEIEIRINVPSTARLPSYQLDGTVTKK